MAYEKAIIHFKKEEFKEALKAFTIHLKSNNNHIEAWVQRGLTHRRLGDFEKSFSDINKALSLMPTDPDLLAERAVAFYYLEKLAASLEDLNKAANLDPNNPYRYSSRAYIRAKAKDVPGAIEDYQKAVELDPEDEIALNNLGLLEESLGRMNQAKQYYDRSNKSLFEQGKMTDSQYEALTNLKDKVDQEEDNGDEPGAAQQSNPVQQKKKNGNSSSVLQEFGNTFRLLATSKSERIAFKNYIAAFFRKKA